MTKAVDIFSNDEVRYHFLIIKLYGYFFVVDNNKKDMNHDNN